MLFFTFAIILTTLFAGVFGAVYPRQSAPACISYECPEIPQFTFIKSVGGGPFFLCRYENLDTKIGCIYFHTSGDLFSPGRSPTQCPSKAACDFIATRKGRILPVAPPPPPPPAAAATPHPVSDTLKMRGQLRKHRG